VAAADEALAGRIACVDLETTGGHAGRDRVMEAGIVLLEDGAIVEEWSTYDNLTIMKQLGQIPAK